MTETQISMTPEEMKAIVRDVVRSELRAVGLHTDDPDHSDKVRDDIRFAGKLRRALEGIAGRIGMVIVLSLFSGIVSLIALGTHTFLNRGQ